MYADPYNPLHTTAKTPGQSVYVPSTYTLHSICMYVSVSLETYMLRPVRSASPEKPGSPATKADPVWS